MLGFLMFPGVQKETNSMKWVKLNKVNRFTPFQPNVGFPTFSGDRKMDH